MSRRHAFALIALIAAFMEGIAMAYSAEPQATWEARDPEAMQVEGAYAEINGLNYYYEVHGEGEPLVLLHGGLGLIDMFAPMLPALTENHRVIAVDLQGHGRTELGDRPIRMEALGDDIAALMDHLDIEKADIMGYSFGGGVALRTAIQHPEKVRRLVVVSAPFAYEGFYPEIREQMRAISAASAEFMKQTPMYRSYAAVAPRPEDFPRLLDAMGEYMRRDYDWSDEVEKLPMPVMLVYADADMFPVDHIAKFYKLLGGGLRDAGWDASGRPKGRLAILPGLTHYSVFASPALPAAVLPFLAE